MAVEDGSSYLQLSPQELSAVLLRQVEGLMEVPKASGTEEEKTRQSSLRRLRDRSKNYLAVKGYGEEIQGIQDEINRHIRTLLEQQNARVLIRDGQTDMSPELYEDALAFINSPVEEPNLTSLSNTLPYPYSKIAIGFCGLQIAIGVDMITRRAERFGLTLPTDDSTEEQ